MPNYTLSLHVDEAILALQSRDSLCIGRKVNGSFTTVFLDASMKPERPGQKELREHNDFSWTDQYRVIGVRDHRHGMLVEASTSPRDIRFGEETSYDRGRFNPTYPAPVDEFEHPSGPRSPDDSFIVKGVSRDVHVGVETQAEGAWAPIYVDPNEHIGMVGMMVTAENEYIIFWSSVLQASTMIDESKIPNPKHFSLDGTSKTLRFGYQTPNQPSSPVEQPAFFDQ